MNNNTLALLIVGIIFQIILNNTQALGLTTINHCKKQKDSLSKRVVYTTVDILLCTTTKKRDLLKIEVDTLLYQNNSHAILAFIVEKDSKVTNERIANKFDYKLGQQILGNIKRAIWAPAYCNGKPLAMLYKLEFNICWSDSKDE